MTEHPADQSADPSLAPDADRTPLPTLAAALPARPVLLRADGVALLLDAGGPGLPAVLHWGADVFGDAAEDELAGLVADLAPAVGHSTFDEPAVFSLLPGAVDGWAGRPALAGATAAGPDDAVRPGAGRYPRWATTGSAPVRIEDDGAQVLEVLAGAREDALTVLVELRLEPCGLLRMRHTLTLDAAGPETAAGYRLDGLNALLPVPARAVEVEDTSGRWCRERSPQRLRPGFGTWAREQRRGRTGHDSPLVFAAGTAGFGFRHGEVWTTHVGWSGDTVHLLDRPPEGSAWLGGAALGGGELLGPGEVVLRPGESHTTPWVLFAHSEAGLDGASDRFHRWLRDRPGHPRTPRPLVLNTWEAVYFDHSMERLTDLAERAADIGVERFVLDDGWFGDRRNDRAGLGDWHVSGAVWPQGLRPLADRVRALGMEFGLWFEPEMVNLDSDLVREHPDWLLPPPRQLVGGGATAAELPRSWRHQYVLDLARPQAAAYLFERLDALVGEIGVAFIKWDHNRDLHETGAHAQTLALYALLDALRARHPDLEIESCASGGARVDLGILQRTDRVWASDTNDPVERQQIQRWTSSLLPLELIGSHIGGPVSHTTGRVTDLSLRGITALFAHAGIEWDITSCDEAETADLRRWAQLYKELRGLLHTGVLVRADPADGALDPDVMVHGVVARDASEAVYAMVRLRTTASSHPGRLRLPGLTPERRYQVVRRDGAGVGQGPAIHQPPWWERGSASARGGALAGVGLAAPLLHPGQAVLVHVRALPG